MFLLVVCCVSNNNCEGTERHFMYDVNKINREELQQFCL